MERAPKRRPLPPGEKKAMRKAPLPPSEADEIEKRKLAKFKAVYSQYLPIPEHLQDRLMEGDLEDMLKKRDGGMSIADLRGAYGLTGEEAYDIFEKKPKKTKAKKKKAPQLPRRKKTIQKPGSSHQEWWNKRVVIPGVYPSAEAYDSYVRWCAAEGRLPVKPGAFHSYTPEGAQRKTFRSRNIENAGPETLEKTWVRCIVIPDG